MSTAAVDRSMERLRTAITAARRRTGLTLDAIARRSGCARTTVAHFERGGAARIDNVVGYAQSVGLDIAAVPVHLARLLQLGPDDIVAVLRAAQAAAEGSRLNPIQSRRVADILATLRPPAGR